MYITSAGCRHYGINRELLENENEQKLEDALNVLRFISTKAGQDSLKSNMHALVPLKDSDLDPNGALYEAQQMIQRGYSAPLVYGGWEDIVIPVGIKTREWIEGKCTGDDVLREMREAMYASLSIYNIRSRIAVSTDNLPQKQSGIFVAEAMRRSADADIGLVSLGAYHDGRENPFGVNGNLFKGLITEFQRNIIIPGNMTDSVFRLSLTGAEIMR